MNKGHLIEKLAQDTGISKALADRMIDSFLGSIAEALKREEKVVLKDFGAWEISNTKERKGVHPQTGEPIVIQAKKRPRFAPGKRLLRDLNRSLKLR